MEWRRKRLRLEAWRLISATKDRRGRRVEGDVVFSHKGQERQEGKKWQKNNRN